MPSPSDPRDRVEAAARHVIDCLDHGYLAKDEAESACLTHLRRCLADLDAQRHADAIRSAGLSSSHSGSEAA